MVAGGAIAGVKVCARVAAGAALRYGRWARPFLGAHAIQHPAVRSCSQAESRRAGVRRGVTRAARRQGGAAGRAGRL